MRVLSLLLISVLTVLAQTSQDVLDKLEQLRASAERAAGINAPISTENATLQRGQAQAFQRVLELLSPPARIFGPPPTSVFSSATDEDMDNLPDAYARLKRPVGMLHWTGVPWVSYYQIRTNDTTSFLIWRTAGAETIFPYFSYLMIDATSGYQWQVRAIFPDGTTSFWVTSQTFPEAVRSFTPSAPISDI